MWVFLSRIDVSCWYRTVCHVSEFPVQEEVRGALSFALGCFACRVPCVTHARDVCNVIHFFSKLKSRPPMRIAWVQLCASIREFETRQELLFFFACLLMLFSNFLFKCGRSLLKGVMIPMHTNMYYVYHMSLEPPGSPQVCLPCAGTSLRHTVVQIWARVPCVTPARMCRL